MKMKPDKEKLINKVVEKLKKLDRIQAIILYGSYAREESDPRSDIDLLIVIDSENPNEYLETVIKSISALDKEGKISPRLTNLKDYDVSFFQNVIREGKVLWGKLIITDQKMGLQPYLLVHYDLTKVPQKIKVQVSRRVYGYTTHKKVKKSIKEYTYRGLMHEEGVLVYPSTVLVPSSQQGFIEFLKRIKVPFERKDIWI